MSEMSLIHEQDTCIRDPGPGNSSAAIVTGTGKGAPLCDGWRLPVGARPIYISLEIGVETLSHPYLKDTEE
jgi:hypothetical protein